MPTYDYQCSACGWTFERRQRFDDEPVAACPKCTARSRRLIHSVPVFFKGSGFYSTDNARVLRDGHNRHDGESESKTETKPKAEAEAQSGTQTATATEDDD